MATEVEARFAATGHEPLDALAAAPALGPATLGPAVAFDEVDRYLDTDPHRLAPAGWACRLRSRADAVRASLKGPPDAVDPDWLHRRPEVEGPATPSLDARDWPESEARFLLLDLSGGRPLHERIALHQRRSERIVRLADGGLADGGRIGTLTLDVVRVERGTALGMLFMVELELADPSPRAEGELSRLADALAAIPGLVAEPRTKLERALELAEGVG
ncbi:MAG: hypothetical protein ACRDGD_08890 [Candidatus Limnocylindria bacterium]